MNLKKKKRARSLTDASTFGNIIINIICVLFCITCIYPVLLVLGISFDSEAAITEIGYRAIPTEFTLYSYKYIFTSAATVLRAYGVTIFVTIVGTVLSVFCMALYGYAISRKEFKYRKFFTFYQFFTMLFGGGMVPWYLVCTQILHINDKIWALILPAMGGAWNIIILKTFFISSVPDGIIESARIDGASELHTFFRIVWPIAVPGIATIALFTVLGYWNDYYNAMMLTSDPKLQNLQLYLYKMLTNIQMLKDATNAATQQAGGTIKDLPKEGARMAICVISTVPIVFAYPFFQRYFVQGLTVGSVKG